MQYPCRISAFSAEKQARFDDALGRLAIEGTRGSRSLSLHHAARHVASHPALAGGAAHGIHPIVGRGLNLGGRDVAAVGEMPVDARRLGLDIGRMDALERYEAWRRPDASDIRAFAASRAGDGLCPPWAPEWRDNSRMCAGASGLLREF